MAKKDNILLSLGLDVSNFDKGLKDLDKGLKASGDKLKDINKALKFDPKNVELLKQKQEALGKSIELSKNKIETFKKMQESLKAQGVDKNSEAFQKLERDISLANSSLKGLQSQLENMKPPPTLSQIGDKMSELGKKTEKVSQVAAAGMVALGGASYMAGQYADDINTLAKVYGMTTEEIQRIKYAADRVDVSFEAVAGSQIKLLKSMEQARQGSKASVEAFQRLGVVYEKNGRLLSKKEVWTNVITKLGQMTNEAERDALAMQLMGKSAAELNPIILEGVDIFEKVAASTRVLSQEELDRANALNDVVDELKANMHSASMELGAAFAPEFEKLGELANTGIQSVSGIANALPSSVRMGVLAVGGGLAGLSTGLTTLGQMAKGLETASIGISKLGGVLQGLNFASKLSSLVSGISSIGAVATPVFVTLQTGIAGIGATLGTVGLPILALVAGIAAIVAIGVVVWKNWDKIKEIGLQAWGMIKEAVGNFWNSTKEFMGNVWDTVKKVFSNIGQFASNIWNGLISGVKGACDFIMGAFKSVGDFVSGIFGGIGNAINGALNFVGGIAKGVTAPKISTANVPRLSVGTDYVHREGMAYIHGGEAVVKAGTNDRYEKLLNHLDRMGNASSEKVIEVATYLDGTKIGKSIHKVVGTEQADGYRRVNA